MKNNKIIEGMSPFMRVQLHLRIDSEVLSTFDEALHRINALGFRHTRNSLVEVLISKFTEQLEEQYKRVSKK